MTHENFPREGLARKPQVLRFLSISNTTLYEGIKRGEIPPPVKIGKCSGWNARAIRALVEPIPGEANHAA